MEAGGLKWGEKYAREEAVFVKEVVDHAGKDLLLTKTGKVVRIDSK